MDMLKEDMLKEFGFDSPIEIGKMSYEEVHTKYRRLEETIHYLLPKLTEREITIIINLATNLCSYCYKNTCDCHCHEKGYK